MVENKLTLVSEKYNNAETGQEIDGITVMIEGKIKEIFDLIIDISDDYTNYSQVLKDSLFMGLSQMIYRAHSKKTRATDSK